MLHVLVEGKEKRKGRTEEERKKKIHKGNLYFTDKRLDVISVLGRVIRVILIHLTFSIQKPPEAFLLSVMPTGSYSSCQTVCEPDSPCSAQPVVKN